LFCRSVLCFVLYFVFLFRSLFRFFGSLFSSLFGSVVLSFCSCVSLLRGDRLFLCVPDSTETRASGG
jgi:hypothetical protein